MPRRLIGMLIVLLVVLPGNIGAHAKLIKSEPKRDAVLSTAPLRVHLWFQGRIEARFSQMSVWDATGKQVDTRDVQVSKEDAASVSIGLAPLTPGTYTVKYRILSVDSHMSEGQFFFLLEDRK